MTEQIPATAEPLTDTETQDLDALAEGAPRVGIIVGDKAHATIMELAGEVLDEAGVRHELRVLSAHREPDGVADYCRNARMRGLRVIIAGAAGAAALPGLAAAHTDLPVVGVPLTTAATAAGGLDAILSIVQLPAGVPVGCVALDDPRNAARLALRILHA
jgi:5-(carboxyamino)imidazole ribonucleotide mutase